MSSERRIPDHWSKSHLSARLHCSLAYWWWRLSMSVCVITLGDLCWVSRRLVQGEDERGGQSREVVRPLFCPGCLGCRLFPPTLSHSVTWEIWAVTKTSNWHIQERETKQQERVTETNTCQTKWRVYCIKQTIKACLVVSVYTSLYLFCLALHCKQNIWIRTVLMQSNIIMELLVCVCSRQTASLCINGGDFFSESLCRIHGYTSRWSE